jgi:hypothetical protein
MRKYIWYRLALLFITFMMFVIPARTVLAISIGDYFSINYTPKFSQTVLVGSETSVLDMSVTATCKQDLPVQANEAQISGKLVAIHETTGERIILIPSYTLDIVDFPSKSGETYQTTQSFTIRFPDGTKSGKYSIAAESSDALVKFKIGGWMNVTRYLPASINLGSIDFTPAQTSSAATTTTSSPSASVISTDTTQTISVSPILSSTPANLPPSDDKPFEISPWLVVGLVALVGIACGIIAGVLLTRKKT